MTESTSTRLFTTHKATGRLLYKLYFSVFFAGMSSLFYYRLTHISIGHRVLWLLMSLSEFWFAVTWVFQQSFRWASTSYVTYPGRLPANLPPIDVMVCTADPDREPALMVANTLLSLMAYDYDVRKLAYYISDDGGSELTFHAVYEASAFAKHWLPFCRKYNVELVAPQAYFSSTVDTSLANGGNEAFQLDYGTVKTKFEEMQDRIFNAGNSGKVPEEIRKQHKGFSEWKSKITRHDHQSIVEVLLRGDGSDVDANGKPMPTLVYVSREKRRDHPHHYKAGALNALNRVSALISNAPFIINVDCDMYSNNSKTLQHAMCFFLDPKESHQIAFVQYPQCIEGLSSNDLYSSGHRRGFHAEFYGTNAYNGPMYCGTGAVHRRESLNGRKYTPDFRPTWDVKPVEIVGVNENWSEFEEKGKNLTSCTYEHGKPWGKEMGLLYGCPVEDVLTGLALHSKGWKSVYFSPERKALLGLSPVNVNESLIQYKRWSTGLFQVFLSDYCPFTHGIGKLDWGEIMCYSFYTLWPIWSLPMLCYALLPPIAMATGISIFPRASDPWSKVFAYLGIASHAFSLGEMIWIDGTLKMWLNETRMWMMRGPSSFFMGLIVVTLKYLGLSEPGFEITSKVIDEEAIKRYKQEMMEFGVASPMFVPPTVLSLLNLYCFLRSMAMIVRDGFSVFDHMALQIILSGYISFISLPLYEAMFLRRDKGRMPTSITLCAGLIAVALLNLLSPFI